MPGLVAIHDVLLQGGGDTTLSIVVGRARYPEPPTDFTADPDVETMWRRWEGFLADREPLPSMAYFCLTVVESHGGRAGAARRLGISLPVLHTIGRLAT